MEEIKNRIKLFLLNLFQPFGKISKVQRNILLVFWVLFIFFIASLSKSQIFPSPTKILITFITIIQEKDIWENFMSSLMFILKGISYALILTMIICYSSRIPFFEPLSYIITKLRYLTFAGVVFLFTMISNTTSDLKTYLLLFGIVPYFTTSFLSILNGISESEINKNFVNRMNRWEALKETVIVGKIDMLLEVLRQNYAIAWMMITMVEAKAMNEGGIGTMLIKSDKYLGKLDLVFAILLFVLIVGIFFDWLIGWIRLTLFEYVSKMLNK